VANNYLSKKENVMTREWVATSAMAKAVVTAGFNYDPDQDIIFSRMDALQRKLGYAYSYDVAAPRTISAIIDCEPFFFSYGGKDWMIELWKGQYGLETGGEIGIYNRKTPSTLGYAVLDKTIGKRPHDPNTAHGKFFRCVSDEDLLTLAFTLVRDGVPLFSRKPEKHWWLTGFEWGVLSAPEELTMELSIILLDSAMCEAFVSTLEMVGYGNIDVDANKVSFIFDKPYSFQPRLDPNNKDIVAAAVKMNKDIVSFYKSLNLRSNDPNQIPANATKKLSDYLFGPRIPEQNFVARLLRDAGCGAAEVGRVLHDVFGLAAADAAQILKQVDYTIEQMADVLKNVFNQSETQAAKILHGVGASFKQVAEALYSVYKQKLAQVAEILVAIGAGKKEVYNTLMAVFKGKKLEVLKALGNLFTH